MIYRTATAAESHILLQMRKRQLTDEGIAITNDADAGLMEFFENTFWTTVWWNGLWRTTAKL